MAAHRRLPSGGRAAHAVARLAAACLILPALAFVALHAGRPSDGAHLRPGDDAFAAHGVRVAPLASWSTLEPGDVVVAVGGVPIDALARVATGGGDAAVRARVAELRDRWRVADSVAYRLQRGDSQLELDVAMGPYPLGAAAARTWGTIVYALVTLVVGAFVYARRPAVPAARALFVAAAALIGATTWSLGLQVGDFVDGAGLWLYHATTAGSYMVVWIAFLHFALLFPEPLAVVRVRWVAPALYVAPFVALGGWLAVQVRSGAEALTWMAALGPLTATHAAIFLALTMMAIVWQFRAQRSAASVRQIRWVVLASLIAGGAGLGLYLVPPLLGGAAVSPNFIGVIVTVFPIAIAVAVLRQNLFDIDTILNRALVYAMLSVAVVGAYVTVVAAIGAVFQARGGLLPSLVATGIVAVAFQPARDRVQRMVNRWMYGERDEPATVLGRLGERLEGALATDEVLPTLVETIALALRLPYVAIDLGASGEAGVTAAFGRPKQQPHVVPLAYQGEAVGQLRLEPRAADEPFTPAELRLIETIARQASVAAYAVRTTTDLRLSRERLVVAREEERRRLRRDLHDGLGPTLAAVALKLDAASNVLDRQPDEARALLSTLRKQVQDAVGDLRRLVYALRPPALDDLGLIGALAEQTRLYEHPGFRVRFESRGPDAEIPAAVEVAAYRVVQEALANVVRHAHASQAWVRLSVGGDLVVVVEDDGVGVPEGGSRAAGAAPRGSGVGIGSMRQRVAELGGEFQIGRRSGGGTRVAARLPLDRLPERAVRPGASDRDGAARDEDGERGDERSPPAPGGDALTAADGPRDRRREETL